MVALTPFLQTHCPVYLVNVSSMSAGDVIAAAKMQGRTRAHADMTQGTHGWALGRPRAWGDMDMGTCHVQRCGQTWHGRPRAVVQGTGCPQPRRCGQRCHTCASAPAGKVVYAETTTAHATLTGLHYYHQDWFHAAAYVTVPPLRLDTNTSAYLMSLLAK